MSDLDEIRDHVIAECGVEPSEFFGRGKHRRFVLARRLYAYLARQLTNAGYPEIAAAAGRKSHSMFVEGIAKVDLSDPQTAIAIGRVQAAIMAKRPSALPPSLDVQVMRLAAIRIGKARADDPGVVARCDEVLRIANEIGQ